MKKWFLFLLVLLCITVNNSTLKADSDYKAYQEIELESGKFLSEYTEKEFKEYYKKVNKRKFFGWRVYEVHKDKKVTYKTETLFSYYNDGTTPIEYTYKRTKKESHSQSLSSTGSIGIDASGSVAKFKGGLSASLKITETEKYDASNQEETTYKASIDPGTMLNLYIAGEGKISNGVACKYVFWIRNKRGGYEVFTITTQYYRLEKIKIWLKRSFYLLLFF